MNRTAVAGVSLLVLTFMAGCATGADQGDASVEPEPVPASAGAEAGAVDIDSGDQNSPSAPATSPGDQATGTNPGVREGDSAGAPDGPRSDAGSTAPVADGGPGPGDTGLGIPVSAPGPQLGDAGWGTPVDGGPDFTGPTVAGIVTVTSRTGNGNVGSGFAGFSFEKTHMTNGTFTGTNAALIALFRLVGPTVIRIGADDVDNCTWDPAATPGGGAPPYSFSVGTAEVDDLADMLTAANARVIYGVNFKADMPANSAAEAAYATTKLGANLYGFEIGNELNHYGSWGSLQSEWESFATAIHAMAPGAPLIGPAGSGDPSALTAPFAASEATGKNLILLTQHYYAGAAGHADATASLLLTADPYAATSPTGLRGELSITQTAAVANKIPDGYRLGECNTLSNHGADGVSNALISGLWALDFMFTAAEYGASGVNFHGGEAGMDGEKPFYYSPIEETHGVVSNATPLFYGMLLFNLAGTGQTLPTTATAGSLTFTAYSIAAGDGSTSVMLVNKDTTSGVRATVDIGVAANRASAIYLQGPTPASLTATTGTSIAGSAITAAGEWNRQPPYAVPTSGDTVTVLVPPASAALVRIQ